MASLGALKDMVRSGDLEIQGEPLLNQMLAGVGVDRRLVFRVDMR